MSVALIRQALEIALAAMASPLPTSVQNFPFNQTTGTPYQKAELLPAAPDNLIAGRSTYFERGIFQVSLYYPNGAGMGAQEARAEAVQTAFRRGSTFSKGGVNVNITMTPKIAQGFRSEDFWCVPISITYQSQIATP